MHWHCAIDSLGVENLQDFDVIIDKIDQNGNIEISITEHTEYLFPGFIVEVKRKRLRRLSKMASSKTCQ